MVQDLGEKACAASGGLVELSRVREDHSERDGHRILTEHKLALPIPISPLQKTPGTRYSGEIGFLRLRDWLQFMADYNCLHILVGLERPDRSREKAILGEFWRLYRQLHPSHELWHLCDTGVIADLTGCYPMLLHGDEGRGKKRSPFLVLAWHSYIGKGTHLSNELRKKKTYLQMRLNYAGNTHTHRFITGALPKMTKDNVAYQDLMRAISEDICDLTHKGITDSEGNRFYAVCLQVVGDWQFLAKCGNLSRSFANVEKRPRGVSSVCRGICHLCKAGQQDVPFEDFRPGDVPKWKQTLFTEPGWDRDKVPAMACIPHILHCPEAIFAYDMWHCYHLGVAKTFLAGVLALMSDCMIGSSIDLRFEVLSNQFLDWADAQHQTSHLQGITKETIGWPDRSTYANGQWSKGHISTCLGKFVKHWLETEDLAGQPLLQKSFEAIECIDACIDELYGSDLWLKSERALSIGLQGERFLHCYMNLATMCFNQGIFLFPYMPKAHPLAHVFAELISHGRNPALKCCINPLAHAVQVDEDFIGRQSRVARRVGPSQVVQRVLQRALLAAHYHWSKCGYIVS